MHAVTHSPWTYVRIIFIAASAGAIARYIPYAGSVALDFIAPRAVNLGILFSITIGFLMYKSLSRRSDMDNYIALELNKIRRMYHLALHIKKAQPAAAEWFAAVRGAVREYLGLFRTATFHEYDLGNSIFRSITYAIYSLPGQIREYNQDLYQSLLTAAADATLAREYIRAKKDDQVSLFSWEVVIFISLAFSVIIIAATPLQLVARGIGATVIFCLFLVLQLIYEHDKANSLRDRAWASRYVTDLESLDHADKMA
jgi:hypothetical protein